MNYPKLTDEQRKTLESHKRECFDAMRAYHNSELAHKKDCIEVFKSILTSVGLLYAGIAGAVSIIGKKLPFQLFFCFLIVVFLSIAVGVIIVLTTTWKKIRADSQRYDTYKKEENDAIKLLGLDKILHIHQIPDSDSSTKFRRGHSYTQFILCGFGGYIIFLSLIATVVFSLYFLRVFEGS